ncbi:hypothetical protein N7509_005263 [Penicillium cosmopolitanum]|uniref:DNA-(apurinic or apyrimidinic site) endonuclease 2 n=1 Tax=Penicillium cosmopolitanum TaxID=1131564 RepID=A0A9W9W215_9EURO|nr:uncharacterized protein N7509_005263 [Penicillium cosmopolitanum]KAJ5397150.1 hypothetical protein N7509_005263 [Penicillium cosmopolitanum]
MGFRITTWNVNGIRNPFSYEPWRGTKTFESMFDILESDIVVFQETKIQRKDLRDDMVLVPGWDCYFSLPRVKKGYSGVVIYTRNATCAPIRAEEGITGVLCPPNSSLPFRELPSDQQIGGYPTIEQLTRSNSQIGDDSAEENDDDSPAAEPNIDAATLDSEGRCVILEFPAFVLIGTYCPAYRDESRDSFRMDFLNALDARVRNLTAMGKRVFLTGDINISKLPIDSAHAIEGIRKCTTTQEEFLSSPPRKLFNELLSDGEVVGEREAGREQPVLHDICRSFHPERTGMYTCWDTRLNTRPGNYGSRIDYVLCSLGMRDWFSSSNIQEGLMGSDHCPVHAVFKAEVSHNDETIHIKDLMNPSGTFKGGERQQEYSSKYMLPTSGRLLPEFDVDKRRSIKDMFSRKPSSAPNVNSTPTASNTPSSKEVGDASTPLAQNGGPPSLSRKRSQPPSISPIKRSKSSATPSGTATSGQKTLAGFFKPRSAGSSTASPVRSGTSQMSPPASGTTSSIEARSTTDDVSFQIPSAAPGSVSVASTETPTGDLTPSKLGDDLVIDPIVSKQDWGKLFTKKPVPKCDGHQEPCISLTTKKPGMNQGRAFWICPRPLGPSGEKEKGTQWRCPTFIWSSDWNSSASTES